MQKTIYVILFFSLFLSARINVCGQSLYELFFSPQTTNTPAEKENYVGLDYSHYHVFDYESEKKEHSKINQEAYNLKLNGNLGKFHVRANYRFYDLDMYTNEVGDVNQDYFQMVNKARELSWMGDYQFSFLQIFLGAVYLNEKIMVNTGLGINLPFGKLQVFFSQEPFLNQFDYAIKEEKGSIHFDFLEKKTTLFFENEFLKAKLYSSKLENIKNDDLIYSDIKGELTGISLGLYLDQFYSVFQLDTGKNIGIILYEEESPFGKLNQFEFYHYLFSLNYAVFQDFFLSIGITGLSANIGEGSYFEIWPFTFWDIFLSSKTRLDKLDLTIHLPFIGFDYAVSFENKVYKGKLGVGLYYYHFIISNQFIISEKVWDVYPFVAHYESRDIDLKPDWDGIFRVKISSSIRYGNFELSLIISQLIPIQFSSFFSEKDSEQINNSTGKSQTSGGTFINISLTGYF